MALPPGSEYFDLSDYLGVLRRRWALIVALALVGLVLGGAYYYVTPKKYAATVLVQVNALPSNANQLGGRTGGPVNMDNEAQIVVSAKVAAIVKAKLHSPLSVTGLAKQLHIAVPPNTTYLQITCTTTSADLARKCANAFGRAYLYNRRTSSFALINSEIKALEVQATQLENTIQKLKNETGKGGFPPSSRKWGVAKLQLNADANKLGTIQNKVSAVTPFASSLQVANSPLVGQVVTPATTPFAPVSPKKKLDLPSGLAGGLVVGLVVAFLLEWRRPRLYSARDVQRKIDLPTVFSLTEVKAGAQSAFAPPRSRTGQTFTELAQYVGAALGDGHHVVMVTATATESGGPVAANLAAALARTRGDTVLICADPRGATIPRLLGASDGRGFAELLAGTASLADVTRQTADLPALEVITPGLDAAGVVYDMQHDKVQRIMRELRREVRYVVIDVPAPGVDADTFSVAEFADAAILTLYAGTARSADVNDCLQRLERLRTAVLAAVLLPPASKGRRSGRRSQAPIDEPYVREPIPREPLIREPMPREPLVREPMVREPMPREPLVREPLVREPMPREPLVREPLVREPQVREPQVREPQARVAQEDAAEPAVRAPYAYSTPVSAPQAQTRPAEPRHTEPRHPDVRYSEPPYNDPLYSDPHPADPRPSDLRPGDPRQPESRHSETRHSETRPSEPRRSESRRSDPRQSETRQPEPWQPEARQPEARPAEIRKPEARPAETRKPEARPAETRKPEARPAETRKPEARPAEIRKPEARLTEARLTEARLTEARPAETRPAETRSAETRPAETRPAETRPAESRPAEGRPTPSFKPHPRPPQVQPVTRDESSTPAKSSAGPPVLRPVAGRRVSTHGGSNGGSRPAASPGNTEDSDQSAAAGFSAWRPRNVSETWPLPASGLPDEDEEPGISDPPSGNLNAWPDRY